jgi:hypothetical protein
MLTGEKAVTSPEQETWNDMRYGGNRSLLQTYPETPV